MVRTGRFQLRISINVRCKFLVDKNLRNKKLGKNHWLDIIQVMFTECNNGLLLHKLLHYILRLLPPVGIVFHLLDDFARCNYLHNLNGDIFNILLLTFYLDTIEIIL